MQLGYAYVNRYFNDATKSELTEMLDAIRTEVIHLLKQTDWMDEITRDAAILKIRTMTYGIGYPDYYNDTKRMDELYKNLRLNADDNLLTNVVKLNKFNVDSSFALLLDKTDFSTKFTPTTVNAFHHGIENKIGRLIVTIHYTIFRLQ